MSLIVLGRLEVVVSRLSVIFVVLRFCPNSEMTLVASYQNSLLYNSKRQVL